MFGERFQTLAARREQLVRDAHQQRERLRAQLAVVDRSLLWVERAASAWRFVKRHPLLVAVPIAAMAILKPRAMQRGIQSALALWSIGRAYLKVSAASARGRTDS